MRKLMFLTGLFLFNELFAQPDFNAFKQNRSNNHEEAIALYDSLQKAFPKQAKLIKQGLTDCGRPLHLFVISPSGIFDPQKAEARNKSVLLINNGIHAGEPCGIDASILFARNLLQSGTLDTHTIVLIIPVFNIGGSLNRGCCSRANQSGPVEYGFRGNGRLLDLNRDFSKSTSKNVREFQRIFRAWDPLIFVDTHTTNGADYQYNMTLIATQPDKLGGVQGRYLRERMLPELYDKMDAKGEPLIPYVNVFSHSPDSGFRAFLETPRYATGYTALFQCIGFVTEAHMLKPFSKRVEATIDFLEVVTEYLQKHRTALITNRAEARKELLRSSYIPITWMPSEAFEKIEFRGYDATYITSSVSGLPVLHYNQEKPLKKDIKWFPYYFPSDSVLIPEAYIVPQAWEEVIEKLKLNKVNMYRLSQDSEMVVEMYRIESYQTTEDPYEGKYPHFKVATVQETVSHHYLKGDYIIPVNQPAKRFIVEMLEPRATDSWFAWNFFDEILQQKEWFSDYVFDSTATRLLEEDPLLRVRLDEAIEQDPELAKNHWRQLYFIYRHSPNYEPSYLRYPVGRMMDSP